MLARKIIGGGALAIMLVASVAAAQTSTTSTTSTTTPTTTPATTTPVTPTVPNTGAGGTMAMNIVVLGVSAALALGGAYIARSRKMAA